MYRLTVFHFWKLHHLTQTTGNYIHSRTCKSCQHLYINTLHNSLVNYVGINSVLVSRCTKHFKIHKIKCSAYKEGSLVVVVGKVATGGGDSCSEEQLMSMNKLYVHCHDTLL